MILCPIWRRIEEIKIEIMPKKGVLSGIKNEYRLELLIMTRGGKFLNPIYEIRKKLGLPVKMEAHHFYSASKLSKEKLTKLLQKRSDEINERMMLFLENCSKEKRDDLTLSIEKILNDNELGEEWFISIANIIISGWLYPPTYNLFVKSNSKNKKISIELNKTTTLEDIKEAWNDYINKEKIKIFGKNKQTYFGKKTGQKLLIAFKDIKERHFNKEALDSVEWKKYKLTDFDRAETILGNSNERKVNFLRQNRKRIKEKI